MYWIRNSIPLVLALVFPDGDFSALQFSDVPIGGIMITLLAKPSSISILAKQFITSLKKRFKNSRSNAYKEKIKKIWLGEIEKTTDLRLIRRYHLEKCKKGGFGFVDDTTWSDLNMDAVFRMIDRCTSMIGSQYLYHLLHKYETDPQRLHKYFREYNVFLADDVLREKIQKPLLRLNRTEACYITDLIFSDLPKRPRHFFLFIASPLLLLASNIAIFFHGVFIFVVMFFMITNLIIHHFYTQKFGGYISDLSVFSHMLGVVAQLSKIDDVPKLSRLQCLQNHCRSASKLNRKIGWLLVDKYSLFEFVALAYDYLNHFFLMDLTIFLLSINEIKANQKSLIEMYENIASLDVSISVASYLNSKLKYCEPIFNEKNLIEVTDVFHPLLKNSVPNTIVMENKSCLITGSNMAGKTTFIKTIGVNILLARSLNICMASSANLPMVEVKTSIKRRDDLEGEKSYYYKEIEVVLEFITLSKNGGSYIFLIDEIFRGTNTNERLSSATAVLNYLCRKNIMMVSTHDMELREFLNEKFEMYHFMEQVKEKVHFFDFLIKQGPCTSRNAIKLLEIIGYPKNIVQEALELSKKLSYKA